MQKLRIAIVEDEAIILNTFSMHVRNMGHEVCGMAFDGNEAVKMINETNPDMVLVDLNLPGKDGISVINEACINKMIPSVIITGHYSTKIINQANIPCVYGYLMKPVREAQVRAAIDIAWSRHLEQKNAQAEAQEYKNALENRKYIERAKGILMDEFGLKENEAMKRLQKMSQDRKKKLVDIAKNLIEAYEKI